MTDRNVGISVKVGYMPYAVSRQIKENELCESKHRSKQILTGETGGLIDVRWWRHKSAGGLFGCKERKTIEDWKTTCRRKHAAECVR